MHRRDVWATSLSVALVVAGVILAVATRHVYWPATLIAGGVLGAVSTLAGPRRRDAWRDWRPPLRTYLIPLSLAVAGLLLALFYASRTSVIGHIGLAVSSASAGLALMIWIKRTLNT